MCGARHGRVRIVYIEVECFYLRQSWFSKEARTETSKDMPPLGSPHRGFSEKWQFWTRFWRSAQCYLPKKVLSFCGFERSERFSHQKSRLFRSGLQLPQACDRSRSERENHGFSAITSSKSIFREIFAIFVRSPSRIFRTITILNTVWTIRTG